MRDIMDKSSASAFSTLVRNHARRNLISGLACPLPKYIQILFRWPSTTIPETPIYILHAYAALYLDIGSGHTPTRAHSSGASVYPARAPSQQYIEATQRALAGSWQQRHTSLHSHAALCTSAVTLTPTSRRPHLK